jgi:hypothetical protein
MLTFSGSGLLFKVKTLQIMPPKEGKKSFVWDYFAEVPEYTNGEDLKKLQCRLCPYTYTRKAKDSSTSCLVFHLLQKHNVSRDSHERREREDDSLHKVQDAGKILKQGSLNSFFGKNRSAEEWCTRQVVLSGLSLRQISDNEFQEVACIALKLKHFKSAAKVGRVVMAFIEDMKIDTRKELAEKERAGERFSAVVDEWTSNRNRQAFDQQRPNFYVCTHSIGTVSTHTKEGSFDFYKHFCLSD